MRNRNTAWLCQPKCSLIRVEFALLSACVIGGCGGGSSRVSPPSSLVYPQSSIKAVVGTAIQSDTPTVSGTVTGFTISPALPAGLALNASGGTISGTPTAVSASASYTVAATNSGGATTATIQIAVSTAAPTNLVYPKITITGLVNTALLPDQPTVTGAVTSYTVSPALPAGVNLDPATGILAGTPTAASPAATYTITATNSIGSTTAAVQIMVLGSTVLLNLDGDSGCCEQLQMAGDRVLSEAGYMTSATTMNGRWVLWDYAAGQVIAKGDVVVSDNGNHGRVALAGQVAAIGTETTVQVLSAVDGSVTASIPIPAQTVGNAGWWQLASDGSYICVGTPTALTIWSPAGAMLATYAGDYNIAVAYAAPTQLQIALGAKGSNVIETISISSGSSSVSPTFSGTFYQWFNDGQRFLSTNYNSNQVWTYSNQAVQQAFVTLPSFLYGLTGQGNWISIGPSSNFGVQVYAIGSTTPALTFTLGSTASYLTSGLFTVAENAQETDIVDLSGTTPTLTKYPSMGPWNVWSFSAISATQWVAGSQYGSIFDGASVAGTPRFLGYGSIQGIAASPSVVAFSTSTGKVLLLDPTGVSATTSIDFWGGPVAISADSSTLGAASGWAATTSMDTDVFYSLASQKLLASFPLVYVSQPYPPGPVLSASGTTVGIVDAGKRYVSDLSGKVSWSDTGISTPIYLSPDGTQIAATESLAATGLYKNGVLVTTLPGYVQGWLDNDHLLASSWGYELDGYPYYTGSTIYSASGAVVDTIAATANLNWSVQDEYEPSQFPTPDTIFIPFASNSTLYSLPSGAAIWTPPAGAYNCAATSPYIVCQVGDQLLLYPQ